MPKGVYVRTDKHCAIIKEACKRPEVQARRGETNKRPEVQARRSEAAKIAQNRPEVRAKNTDTNKKPEVQARRSEASKIAQNKPEIKLKHKETHVGGFCIQNIIYDEREGYCDVWGPPLWERIDEYQGYKSIISGKTKENNNGKELTRHHLYWQKKACCGYDEDTKGYYAMINLGTRGKPNMHKHYIKGSPNKFVLLTLEEHGMIRGNKKLSTNKLTWIIYLENLVETKLGGKTFYTEEEYNKIKEARCH